MKKLIFSPHIDDELLMSNSLIDEETHIIYCGYNEDHLGELTHIQKRPKTEKRIEELDKCKDYLGFTYELSDNKINYYQIQPLTNSFEQILNKVKPDILVLSNPSYNQDHKTVYDAAIVATRPHDRNFFIKKIVVAEQIQDLWEPQRKFNPTYFVPLDIDRKIKAYKLMKSQVRSFRSPEQIKALAKVRGAQSNLDYAEAFEILRWID